MPCTFPDVTSSSEPMVPSAVTRDSPFPQYEGKPASGTSRDSDIVNHIMRRESLTEEISSDSGGSENGETRDEPVAGKGQPAKAPLVRPREEHSKCNASTRRPKRERTQDDLDSVRADQRNSGSRLAL